MMEEAKWKPLKPSLPREIENQKQYCILRGIAEMGVIIKNLKETGWYFHYIMFNSLICSVQKTDGE